MKRVTIKDIANRVGVSASTVSRALSGDPFVNSETRERILSMADKMGYKRNPIAANFRTGRSYIIGVVVPELLSPFNAEICRGVQRVARSNGFTVMIASSEESCEREREHLKNLMNAPIDGLLISSVDGETNLDAIRAIQASGVPVVFYDREPLRDRDQEFSSVVTQDRDKAAFMTEHLLSIGGNRIVHLRGPRSIAKYNHIYSGYCDTLKKEGVELEENLVIDVETTVDAGRRAADRLLDAGMKFDAVFASGDLQAIGMMNRLRERGVKVPEEVAVAGFSGSPLSRVIYPSLTTVEPELNEMGSHAAELLLTLIKNPRQKPRTLTVGANIRLRESSRG